MASKKQGIIKYSDIDSQKHANRWLKLHIYCDF